MTPIALERMPLMYVMYDMMMIITYETNSWIYHQFVCVKLWKRKTYHNIPTIIREHAYLCIHPRREWCLLFDTIPLSFIHIVLIITIHTQFTTAQVMCMYVIEEANYWCCCCCCWSMPVSRTTATPTIDDDEVERLSIHLYWLHSPHTASRVTPTWRRAKTSESSRSTSLSLSLFHVSVSWCSWNVKLKTGSLL